MRETKIIAASKTADKAPKAKTRYIVSHEYKGSLSMQTAFQELIEHNVCNQFEQWKGEKPKE